MTLSLLCEIGVTTWLVWALIGIVGGYMAGRLLDAKGIPTWVAVIVGIGAAIGGGYAFIQWFGQNDYGQTISLVGAVAVAAIILWLVYLIFGRSAADE